MGSHIVTFNHAPIELQGSETCESGVQGYIGSFCENGKGKIGILNSTFGNCTVHQKNEVVLVATIFCDGHSKYESEHTTTPSTQPYSEGRGCDFSVQGWAQGQENAHPGACLKKWELVV